MRFLLLPVLVVLTTELIAAPLYPASPSIPGAYEVLSPQSMISDARVDFDSVIIDYTNGYTVISPDGDIFVVDDIEDPKCALYTSYVVSDDSGFFVVPEIISNVHIGEVNFENCQ